MCSLLLTRSQKNSNPNYTFYGQTLGTVSSSKYQGLTIQSNIGWDRHIDSMCAKANRMLGYLRRNLKIGSRKVKESAYKAMIRPILEYVSSVWDTHTKKNISEIKMVLNRHNNTSSVEESPEVLGWPTLQQRRCGARLNMLQKLTSSLA